MKSRLRAIARETVEIVTHGDLRDQTASSVTGTVHYRPGDPLPPPGPAAEPVVTVTGETTLAATRRLGGDVACLNFASARSPGGGFLNGAQAQEESLARSSGLYPCLLAAGDFYAHHRADPSLLYSDRVIYSPRVPVFRDDEGTVLPAYPVTFLTAAAPNHAALVRNQPDLLPEVPPALARRAGRILRVAAAHGHRRLVLGAWGCGVFGNDPATVASAFGSALRASPWFDEVVFAILDRAPSTPIRTAFELAFPASPST